jgi:hypothetical protein
MFGDGQWIFARTDEQIVRYRQWLAELDQSSFVAIELGAGTAIPTVRGHCEEWAGKLIRINLREAEVPEGGVAISLGAHEALSAIDQCLKREKWSSQPGPRQYSAIVDTNQPFPSLNQCVR